MNYLVNISGKLALTFLMVALSVISHKTQAAPPQLQTPAPVIYLADNLDEQDKLGWCIDTQGRGLSERLHAHSCKPQGGDVQFKFKAGTGQIMSAEYAAKCAELLAPGGSVTFGLLACKAGAASQSFTFDSNSGEFHPKGKNDLCLVVGAGSRSAGPFMSRNLDLAACASTAVKFKKWIVKAK